MPRKRSGQDGRAGPRTPEPRSSDLGKRLTAARLAAGLTQTQLAEHLGADHSTVQRWELGEAAPRGLYAEAVERFLAGR